MFSQSEIRHGYFGARRLAGLLPTTYYAEPDEFPGGTELCIFGQSYGKYTAHGNKKRLERWAAALPKLRLKTLVLECTASQKLFDAATQIDGIEALALKHSSVRSLVSLNNCKGLRAFEFGSRFSVANLAAIESCTTLQSLRLFRTRSARNLEFVRGLSQLEEFGFIWDSIDTSHTIESLLPIQTLRRLKLLWLSGVKLSRDGLLPLKNHPSLVNLQVSFTFPASEFEDLRGSIPTLKYGSPFEEQKIREFCRQ